MNDEVIVVFGGSGFIGSHLLQRLAATHNSTIVSVDIRPPRNQISGLRYIEGDVRQLAKVTLPPRIDRIYNLAAVHTTPGHPNHEYYDTNISGATQITALARRTGCNNIIFTSSISVYGAGEDTKSEESHPAPESAYGWSKLLAEEIHRSWQEEDTRRRLIICRPAVIFGNGERGNFTRLAKMLRTGLFIFPGRRDTIKACFYVDDLLDALSYAVELDDRYILFNGCYPDRYTLEQIIATFRADHFPNLRTITLPSTLMQITASLFVPLTGLGLGIHPERITKLIRSTDIRPQWLLDHGRGAPDQLYYALSRWATSSNGQFD